MRLPMKPGNFLVDHHCPLAGAPDQLDGPAKDGAARLGPGADLDQGDELRRIPEVGRNHAIAPPDTGDQGARRLAARRAEDGRGRTVAVKLCEDRVLQGVSSVTASTTKSASAASARRTDVRMRPSTASGWSLSRR